MLKTPNIYKQFQKQFAYISLDIYKYCVNFKCLPFTVYLKQMLHKMSHYYYYELT